MKYKVDEQDLKDVANAIRSKTGNDNSIEFPNGFISEIQGITTGSNTAQGLVHLTTPNDPSLYGKEIIGTDTEGNTVSGVFDGNGLCDIIVPTDNPWVFECEEYKTETISTLSLSASREMGWTPIIYDNGKLNHEDYQTKLTSNNTISFESNYIRLCTSNNSTSSYLYWKEDLTNVSSVKITYNISWNSNTQGMSIGTLDQINSAGPAWSSSWTKYNLVNTNDGTRTIDVSDLSGEYYVVLFTGGSSTGVVFSVYSLELILND